MVRNVRFLPLARRERAPPADWTVWVPVFFAAGAGSYLSLPVEPPWPVFVVVVCVIVAAVVLVLTGRRAAPLILMAFFLAGFGVAKARGEWVRAPLLPASTGQLVVTGWIESATRKGASSARVVVYIETVDGLLPKYRPRRVQLRLAKARRLPTVGQYVRLKANLYPLVSPVAPGGYDHARVLWFRGIGGSGFAVLDGSESTAGEKARHGWRTVLADLRAEIRQRIYRALPAETAGVATALIIGERAGIGTKASDDLRAAGLAHILAISGLHMSIVCGGIFWLVRALLALLPHAAMNWPIKKLAAVAALVMGLGYLLLSGAGIATQRAYIMLAIMFTAVLADRPAVSMRNLVIAAMIIMIMTPEAVLSAGFQMSFLAVMGLIAGYEALNRARREKPRPVRPTGPVHMVARMVITAIAAMAFTTLIASTFTAIPAAYHFGRVAPYSLIANIAALPILTFLVMPTGVAAVLTMPLGLEGAPLAAMALGIEAILHVAEWVADLPGAGYVVPAMPTLSALMLALAGMILCLMRGPGRFAGMVLIVPALWLASARTAPDILIERKAVNVAVRNEAGQLVPALATRGKFSVAKWLLRDGDTAKPGQAARRAGWVCTKTHCTAHRSGRAIVYLIDETAPPTPCQTADIVIAAFPLRGRCKGAAMRIDRFDVWRHGAHALYFTAREINVRTVAKERGQRLWTAPAVARADVLADVAGK